ncbi:LOW QUALITY PROTEIN: DNA repair protein RAD51 homolog 2 [Geothlypis trichas]
MAAKKLRRAQLSQEMCERLSRYQITTCQDFLCLSLLELMKVTGQSYYEVQKLLRKVSRACAPKMQTAYEMKLRKSVNPSSAFLSTTLHGLDRVLHGGVPCGSLTEITSPPGCGKTQFCIMLSVLATLPVSMGGLDGAVIYIDTESAFSAERLIEIAANRFPAYYDSDEKLLCMTRSIHLYRELTCCSVLKRIMSLEEEIILKKVKLVIIDSVASVVRKEFDTKLQGNLAERSNFLTRGASVLKYLAEEFSIPVILTNQITTALSSGPGPRADLVSPADDLSLSEVLVPNGVKKEELSRSSESGKRDSGYVTAALGNTWSHSVNTRLILQYHDLPTRQAEQVQLPHTLLKLQTLHQPCCPSLDLVQHLNVLLVWRSPEQDTGFVVPHQCRVQGTITPLVLLATQLLMQSRMLAFLATRTAGSCSARCQPALPATLPQPVALPGVVVMQVQDLALHLIEHHMTVPSIQPVQAPLQSIPVINTPAQLAVACKLLVVHFILLSRQLMKTLNSSGPNTALESTTGGWSPTGCSIMHHHSLGPATQTVFHPAARTPTCTMASQFLLENAPCGKLHQKLC